MSARFFVVIAACVTAGVLFAIWRIKRDVAKTNILDTGLSAYKAGQDDMLAVWYGGVG